MVRTRALGVSLLLLAACTEVKGVEVDARRLIPAEANLVFGFELGPLKNSPFGPIVYATAASDGDLAAALTAAPNCKVDLEDLRVTFAGVLDQDDKFMAVVESPGIGQEDTIRCIEQEQAKAAGREGPWMLLFETRGDVRTIAQEGGGKLIILNKNTIIMTEAAWESAVFDAIEKPETRVTTSPLASAALAIDAKTDAWMVMAPSDADRASLGDIKGADGLVSVAATGDLGAGLGLVLTFATSDAAKASEFKSAIDEILATVKAEPGSWPADIVGAVVTTAQDASVTAKVDVSSAALPTLLTSLAPLFVEE